MRVTARGLMFRTSRTVSAANTLNFAVAEVSALYFVTLRPEEIDWAGLRAAAVAIGIRPAARQAARDLPPEEQERFVQRAMKHCSREKWLVKARQGKAEAAATATRALSATVRTGANALANALSDESCAIRMNVAAALCEAAEHLAEMPGEKLLEPQTVRAFKNLAHWAASVHLCQMGTTKERWVLR